MKNLTIELNRFKQRLKTSIMAGGIVLSSLSGASAVAAQNTQNKNQDRSALVIDLDQLHSAEKYPKTGDNLYQYFYKDGTDSGIHIEIKDLAKGLAAACVTSKSAQFDQFCTSYLNYIDNNGKITFWNFNKVLQESLSPEQITAFSDALLQAFKERETPNFKKKVASPKDNKWKSIKNKYADIKYSFSENGMRMQGTFSMNLSNLIPPVIKLENGKYKCGIVSHSSYSLAKTLETSKLKRVIMEHYVYNDLLNSGYVSTPAIERFLNRHQQDMKKHGLIVDKTGRFIQKDRQKQMKFIQDALSQKR